MFRVGPVWLAKWIARILAVKVWLGWLTNNISGKREDCHGRTYRQAYRKFGWRKMALEHWGEDSWMLRWPYPRFGKTRAWLRRTGRRAIDV